MGHPISLRPEAFSPASIRSASPQRRSALRDSYGSQNDRALARMLGASLLLGLGVTGGAAWGLWSVAASLLG